MTVFIIIGIAILVGVVLIGIHEATYHTWLLGLGLTICFFAVFALLINLAVYFPAKGNSQITYEQLIAEKETIETMLETEQSVDRLLLNEKVIDYNNRITKHRHNSTRFIYKDYYDTTLPWEDLRYIQWR